MASFLSSSSSSSSTSVPRIPTKSSEIIKTMFGLTPNDLGILARKLTEMVSPPTQGKNAYALANYIIDNPDKIGGQSSAKYQQAIFFKQITINFTS
jgi:hypothetical protein